MITLIEYPACSTCKKAKRHLQESGLAFEPRNIVDQRPSKEELRCWQRLSGLPLKRLFNSSGKVYQKMDLKHRLADMDEEAMLDLLASDGMLIKRPILVMEDTVLIGYRKEAYDALLSRKQ